MTQPEGLKRMMKVKEVAAVLSFSPRTVHKLIHKGALPASRIGRTWRISEEALAEYLKSQE